MDSAADFERKTREMFRRYERFVTELAFRFVVEVAEHLVDYTPGFGNQAPEDTEYIPTGRLRGGYHYAAAPQATASRWVGGPYSDYGVETVDRIEADMRAAGLRSFWIVNDVAYGYVVQQGRGRHSAVGPRDFNGDAAAPTTQGVAFRRALSSMGGFR